jgi:hypothetical protein
MKGQNLGSYFLISMALHMTFKIKNILIAKNEQLVVI